jgi:hypothetical protein
MINLIWLVCVSCPYFMTLGTNVVPSPITTVVVIIIIIITIIITTRTTAMETLVVPTL